MREPRGCPLGRERGKMAEARYETTPRAGDLSRTEKILRFHDTLIESIRGRPEPDFWVVSGWSSQATQRLRFEQLLRVSRYRGGSVLDWGSGAGDLYDHLMAAGYDFTYTGLDMNPRMLALAEHRYGKLFSLVDVSHRLTTTYDYIFANGIFQFIDLTSPRYYIEMLRNMFEYARRAVAVTFLSSSRDDGNKVPDELYLDPASLFAHIQSLSKWWALDHGYHPGAGDFTVALLKPAEDQAWHRPHFEPT